MTRSLEVLDGADATGVAAALRVALSNDGPAILPREGGMGRGRHAAPALGDPEVARDAPVPAEVPRAVALVIETSGSSGVPKRVALSTDALLASAAAVEVALGGQGQWLLALPTHYIAGVQVLVRSIVAGTTPVVQPPGHFSASAFAGLADELDAPLRFTSLVPAQLARLVTAAEADSGIRRSVARFDSILIGGQALPAALYERAKEAGFPVVRTYGSSETAGGCVYDGRAIGQTVARESGGEIELSGPTLAEGYLGDDELTARKFRFDDGVRWYRTADSGTVVDGLVRVTGRLDNVIISGGVKVALDRVERVVQAVAGFEQAVVVPQRSAEWGQVSVVVTDGPVTDASLEQVRSAVIDSAGRAAAPVEIQHVEQLPRLSSGKPDRLAIARSLQGRAG
ncbi:AMP-binding protein [Herbiconiux ginsengi]|uniref:O-succinylbenzoic acid--CoA ligase n=1 Tax=Herbiconiux ginsengi TaxID=381665 RepID=A0A1H3L3W1_9MICO|nr:AMP-binding protein [Herbiconiux ginsengi]SDY59091.1 O-succinylbenzoic acid--CoA ligase [Herbiconiux ginsengi]